jgi:hypothetical protein
MLKQTLTATLILLFVVSMVVAAVYPQVYLWDANTPLALADVNRPPPSHQTIDHNSFIYRDIMVGTQLVIIIDSNEVGYWSGGLYINGQDRNYGILSARDFNEISRDWDGSHLMAAGKEAHINSWADDSKKGFDFYSDDAIPGKWFLIDYNAIKTGTCNIGFYEYDYNNPYSFFEPIYNLTFNQVPTRDFTKDNIVNFKDFASLTSFWHKKQADFNDSDWHSEFDFDKDKRIDVNDLILFTDFWLERTRKTAPEPNLPQPKPTESK